MTHEPPIPVLIFLVAIVLLIVHGYGLSKGRAAAVAEIDAIMRAFREDPKSFGRTVWKKMLVEACKDKHVWDKMLVEAAAAT